MRSWQGVAPAVCLRVCELTAPAAGKAGSEQLGQGEQSWMLCHWLAVGQITPSSEADFCVVTEVRAASYPFFGSASPRVL